MRTRTVVVTGLLYYPSLVVLSKQKQLFNAIKHVRVCVFTNEMQIRIRSEIPYILHNTLVKCGAEPHNQTFIYVQQNV